MRKKILAAVVIGVAAIVLVIAAWVRHHPLAVLQPKGVIAAQQRDLMVTATALMLLVVIPVFIMTFVIAWKYRAGNQSARYTPDWDHHAGLEFLWWAFPCAIILVLSVITWNSSHRLDPYRPLASTSPALTVQVVALQWKWLFIYPEQRIASLNFVEFPADTPVNFVITADAPMNSFWIPQLGGQVYAMSGMSTQLHLMAAAPGDFRGSSANLSGKGFADMNFTARAASQADFDAWVQGAKRSRDYLSLEKYKRLAEPSQADAPRQYSSTDDGLFEAIVMQYMAHGSGSAAPLSEHQHAGGAL